VGYSAGNNAHGANSHTRTRACNTRSSVRCSYFPWSWGPPSLTNTRTPPHFFINWPEEETQVQAAVPFSQLAKNPPNNFVRLCEPSIKICDGCLKKVFCFELSNQLFWSSSCLCIYFMVEYYCPEGRRIFLHFYSALRWWEGMCTHMCTTRRVCSISLKKSYLIYFCVSFFGRC